MFWLPLTARPMKFELGSKSPLTYSRAGEVAVPRFMVWLIWSAPPQLLVTVTWLAVEVDNIRSPSGLLELPLEYWQAWVLLSTWVCGLAARLVTKFWMMVGVRLVSAAIERRPVPDASPLPSLTSLPCTQPRLA